ncbi:MAG: hypothetical protein M1812_007374 [Candelaria pacifica]|nr:MAG: hypothetical protein M1812_007374 [Candelaria pacifica]
MLSNFVVFGLFTSGALASFTKGTTLSDIQNLQGRQVAQAYPVPVGTCAKTPALDKTAVSVTMFAEQTNTVLGMINGAAVLYDSSPADCAAAIIAAGLTSSIPASLTMSRTSTASNNATTTRSSTRSSSTGSVRSTTTTARGTARPSGTGVIQVSGNTTRPGVAQFTGGANSQSVAGGSGALFVGFLGMMGYML